jgi:tetratricopeptide (TPR) repeat protein
MPIAPQLITLETVGLIRQIQTQPEALYLFRHALIREAAYASLLRADRAALHRAVGEVLEQRATAPHDEHWAVLAHHFEYSGDETRALGYYTQAGDAALQRYANAEAIQHYANALGLAARQPLANTALIHLYSQHGRALELNAQYTAALNNYAEMEAVGLARHDPLIEVEAVIARAVLRSTFTPVYDEAESLALTERALTLARALGDPRLETRALWTRMHATTYQMTTPEAIGYGEQAIALARQHGFQSELAFALNDITWNYVALQRFDDGLQAAQEANALWRALGNRPMLADNLNNLAFLYARQNQLETALACLDEAQTISRAIGNAVSQARVIGFRARYHYENGRLTEALAGYEEILQLTRAHGLTQFEIQAHFILAGMAQRVGYAALSLHLTQQIQTLLPQNTASNFAALTAQLYAIIARLRLGATAEVATDLAAARAAVLDNHENNELSLWVFAQFEWLAAQSHWPEALALLRNHAALFQADDESQISFLTKRGLAEWRVGQVTEAYATFHAALALARPKLRMWQLSPVAYLSQVAQAHGAVAEAQALAAEARALARDILAHMPTEWQPYFLQLPEVQPLGDLSRDAHQL